MDKLDTVECMTDRYFERGGRTLIGIYYLPQMTQHNRFTVFMNSLLITAYMVSNTCCRDFLKNRFNHTFFAKCILQKTSHLSIEIGAATAALH